MKLVVLVAIRGLLLAVALSLFQLFTTSSWVHSNFIGGEPVGREELLLFQSGGRHLANHAETP